MLEVFDWQRMADQRLAVRRVVQALRDGQLAGLPTETVYGVAADARSAEAVERLVVCKGRPEEKPMSLALRTPIDLPDWVPRVDRIGRRLTRRCWPGPLTVVFGDSLAGSKVHALPNSVRARISPHGTLGIRVPLHEAIREVMTELGGPLVLTSANRSGEPDAITGQEVVTTLGDQLAVIIDDGLTQYGRASTIVRVADGRWDVLREGALRAKTLEKLASCVILFVCTGNTCRSPLAEGICKKLLAERIGCTPDELVHRGFLVQSAGISAMTGCGATPEAVDTARALGINLDAHVSRPLPYDVLAQAEFVFTMTRSHGEMLSMMFGEGKHCLLSPDAHDIPDPIGGDRAIYEQCSQQIRACLEKRLDSILDS